MGMRHTHGVRRGIVEWFDRLAQKRKRKEETQRDHLDNIMDIVCDGLKAVFHGASAAPIAAASPASAFMLAAAGLALYPGARIALGF
jgi:hypothetical protein